MTKAILITTLLCLAVASPLSLGADVHRQAESKWEIVPAMLVSEVPGFTPAAAVKLSRYGGYADRRVKATGYFRTEKINDRWWLVDPDGCLFLSAGICSVNLAQSKGSVESTSFTNETVWADSAAALLRTNGFNTLGCWGNWQAFRGDSRIPYTTQLGFMEKLGKKLKITEKGFGNWKFPKDCLPLFHPEFEPFCDELAKQLVETRDDPWLLGHFSDNELPFRPESLDNYLSLPAEDPGHVAAQKWWDDHRKSREKIEDADREAFLQLVAHRYYSVVGAAIRKYDPNHLYLGSRIHGKCIAAPVLKGSTPVDVVSINFYHQWSPNQKRLQELSEQSGRPLLISEWYAMKLNSPEQKPRGAGWRVSTEAERGMFYQNFTIGLLQNPACVGWHWFKYGGDNEEGRDSAQIGTVDVQYRPRVELLKFMSELNAQIYPLADFFSKKK